MSNGIQCGLALLDSVYEKIEKQEYFLESIEKLFYGLKDLRNSLSATEWEDFSLNHCIKHPLKQIIHEDPFTFRAFAKPRGYSGDAVTIDFIYKDNSIRKKLDETTQLGRKIYEYTSSAPASCAVRGRRDIITQMIDETADKIESPHILSLACGHLNEAKYAKSVKDYKIGKYIAFDQDLKSLNHVDQEFARFNVSCVHGTIKGLIKKETDYGKFDLVYALGLFDYLPQPIARRLTNIMFEMLTPCGRILIGNFLKNIRDIGYMETYMGWKLIYRDTDEMEQLGSDISDAVSQKRVFIEENKNIVFLEICKL